jgi:hypothetical protein
MRKVKLQIKFAYFRVVLAEVVFDALLGIAMGSKPTSIFLMR